MSSRKLREEYNIQAERRNRHIKQLIEESIINVLAEQQAAPVAPVPPTNEAPPPPVATPDNQANGTPDGSVPKQYTVDDMIQELNTIRGGKSFTDPEVYGRLVTFFKNLSEEQKIELDVLLSQIAELVTTFDGPNGGSSPSNQNNGTPPPQANNGQPPPDAAQKSAPMPGAQQSAGAAGVGA